MVAANFKKTQNYYNKSLKKQGVTSHVNLAPIVAV
jgi:hypothetical protein